MSKVMYCANLQPFQDIAEGLSEKEIEDILNKKGELGIPYKQIFASIVLLAEKSKKEKEEFDICDWECELARHLPWGY